MTDEVRPQQGEIEQKSLSDVLDVGAKLGEIALGAHALKDMIGGAPSPAEPPVPPQESDE
jgi:hypothetical protein